MGLFRVRGRLTGPTGRSEDAELLVDAGASELMEFTVIGGNVNLAALGERLTRDHRVEILVTEAVRQTSIRGSSCANFRPWRSGGCPGRS